MENKTIIVTNNTDAEAEDIVVKKISKLENTLQLLSTLIFGILLITLLFATISMFPDECSFQSSNLSDCTISLTVFLGLNIFFYLLLPFHNYNYDGCDCGFVTVRLCLKITNIVIIIISSTIISQCLNLKTYNCNYSDNIQNHVVAIIIFSSIFLAINVLCLVSCIIPNRSNLVACCGCFSQCCCCLNDCCVRYPRSFRETYC